MTTPGADHGRQQDRDRERVQDQDQDQEQNQRGSDTGSATVYAALLAGLLTTVTAAVLALGAAILARHRAATAADLAALAAARRAESGQPACDWAARLAAANHAALLHCACDGAICLVSASVRTPWGSATVAARAGPADDTAGPVPVIPSAPALFLVRIRGAEPEPRRRRSHRPPAAPGSKFGTPFTGPVDPDAQQPYRDQEQPAEYRAGDEDLRRGGPNPDAEKGQVVRPAA
ncbi:MAG: hypothetical protein HOV87_08310 [Catenulispora sp.]|nr:hypothetical protein [Catenulispora sp.]